jgi:hypothetical protein
LKGKKKGGDNKGNRLEFYCECEGSLAKGKGSKKGEGDKEGPAAEVEEENEYGGFAAAKENADKEGDGDSDHEKKGKPNVLIKCGCPFKVCWYKRDDGLIRLTSFVIPHNDHPFVYDMNLIRIDQKIDVAMTLYNNWDMIGFAFYFFF